MKLIYTLFFIAFLYYITPSKAQFEVCGAGIDGFTTDCCLDESSGWTFGYCLNDTFIDLCLDFNFGRCRWCTSEFSCNSNAVPEEVNDCIQEETNAVRQDNPSTRFDHIRRNLHLSDLALGHSCYWGSEIPLGHAGDYKDDRQLLVSADLPFWLSKEYPNSGVCSEVVSYTEFYFNGTCDQIYDAIENPANVIDILAAVTAGTFSGKTQTIFFGLGVYSETDAIGPYAVTFIIVQTIPNPSLAGQAGCSGNTGADFY